MTGPAGSRVRSWAAAGALALAHGLLLAGGSACGSDPFVCPDEDAGAPDADEAGAAGMVHVVGNFTNMACPAIDPISVGPDNGGMATVEAIVLDPAGVDAAATTLTWSATKGIFANAHAAQTTFMCVDYGMVTVTLTVGVPGCVQQAAANVTCDTLAGQ